MRHRPCTTNPDLWRLVMDAQAEVAAIANLFVADAAFPDHLATLALALHAASVGADELRVAMLNDGDRYVLPCTPRDASHA